MWHSYGEGRHSHEVESHYIYLSLTLTRYTNSIEAQIGVVRGPISRMRSLSIEFTCEFEIAHRLSVATSLSPTLTHIDFDMGQGEGSYSVDLQAFADDTFASPVDDEVELFVPDPIHVQVATINGLVVQFKECWATPT